MRALIAALLLAGCSASAQDDPNVMNVVEHDGDETDIFIPIDLAPLPPPPPTRSSRNSDMIEIWEKAINAPRAPNAHDVIYRNLAKFAGKPPDYAFSRLGYPDGKLVVNNAIVYSWTSNATNRDGGQLTCKVKVVVRAAKIIEAEHDGNAGACVTYARKLDPSFTGQY